MNLNEKLASIFEKRSPQKGNFILSEATPERPGWKGKGSMPLLGRQQGPQSGQDASGVEGWTNWENAKKALEKGQSAVQVAMDNPDMDDAVRAKLDKVVERMSSAAGQLSRQGKLTPELAKSSMGALSGLAQSGGPASSALQKAIVGMKNHAGDAGVPPEEMAEYNKVADNYAQQV